MSSLVKLIKNVTVSEEKRHQETKYCANTILDNQPISNTLVSGGVGSQWQWILPKMYQGPGSFQRDGARISAQRLLVNVQLDFDPQFQVNFDGWVKLFFVTSKRVKSYDQADGITAGSLLDLGNGTTSDWETATPSISAVQPVSNENFSVVKTKIIRMSKNVGQTTGSATNTYSTNLGHSSSLHSFKIKVPHNLIYPDGVPLTSAVYPSNHAIFMGLVYWSSDSTQFEGNVIRATVHSHLYYKDA